jgi:transcriptional regulator with XRE-family HTH domain
MVTRYNPEERDEGESPLAYWRTIRGVTQEEMADAVGISLSTYRRLERGRIDDPGVRVLHNCAIALGVPLYEIIPSDWHEWTTFDPSASKPPKWETFFHPEREGASEDLSTTLPKVAEDLLSDAWLEARRRGLEKLAESFDEE